MRRSFLPFILLALLVAAACNQGPDWTPEQKAVHDAMENWAEAVDKNDVAAMWDMLSPDAQDKYRRELVMPGGAQATVKMSKAALAPDARTPPAERERLKKVLATLPEHPEKMTPKDYYIWRMKPKLTPEGAERTHALFSWKNIDEISIEGDRATVVVKSGDPSRYSWVRHDGVWKFDVNPSILRALEDARARENKANQK